jgi:nitrate reductase NapE component
MADTVQIGNTGHTAKVRHPVAVSIFSFITLGIYFVYWWYQVNREVVDLGRARNVAGLGDNPTVSALAMFPGVLVIVPPYVSLYNGVKRFQRAQQATLEDSTLNGWIVLALIVAGLFTVFAAAIVPGYIQAELNKIWETQPRVGIEAAAGDSDLDRIKKLAELKDTGAISAEEFETEKARVLRHPTQGSTTEEP